VYRKEREDSKEESNKRGIRKKLERAIDGREVTEK
jgi:hypothetical protein